MIVEFRHVRGHGQASDVVHHARCVSSFFLEALHLAGNGGGSSGFHPRSVGSTAFMPDVAMGFVAVGSPNSQIGALRVDRQ